MVINKSGDTIVFFRVNRKKQQEIFSNEIIV